MSWSRKQISILIIVATTSFMATFLISSVNIALPAIEKSFHLDAIRLSWVVTAFLLSTALFLLPAGRFGDITGVRNLFKIGLLLFTAASILCGFSVSGNMLIILRFIQGIGGAFASTTGPAILVSAFPQASRGRVLGTSVAATYSGLAFGPFAGGIITQYLGWQYIFHISSFLGILTIIFTFLYLGKDEKSDIVRQKIKLKNSLFYMLGLTGLVYGSSLIPNESGWILIGGGILLILLFWILESRSSAPVFDTKLFTQNRLFAFSNLAALINYSATFAIVFLISLYLQTVKGLSPRDAGIILVAQPAIMALFSPITGSLSDKIQARILASTGMVMCTIGLVGFSFANANTPIWIIVMLLIWMGLGFALFSSPNMNTIMSSVGKSRYGQASGSAATMRVVGQIISMSIVTFMIAIFIGDKAVEMATDAEFIKTMHWGFYVFAGISVFGIYFSLFRGKMDKTEVED